MNTDMSTHTIIENQIFDWCSGALRYGGGFVQTFARLWRTADDDNQEILRPALMQLMAKYSKYIEMGKREATNGAE
jgi:hypothetical protein